MRGTGLAIPAIAALVAIATTLTSILALEFIAALVAIFALALEALAALLAPAFTWRALAAFARLPEIAVAIAAAAMLAGFFTFGCRGRSIAWRGLRGIALALVAVAVAATTLVARAALLVTAAGTPDFDQGRFRGSLGCRGSSLRRDSFRRASFRSGGFR